MLRIRWVVWTLAVVIGLSGCEAPPPLGTLSPEEQLFAGVWTSEIIPLENNVLSSGVSYEVTLNNRQSMHRWDPPSVWGVFKEQQYFKSKTAEGVLWVLNEGNPTVEYTMIPALQVQGLGATSTPLNGEWLGLKAYWELHLEPTVAWETGATTYELVLTLHGTGNYQNIRLKRSGPEPEYLPVSLWGY